MENLLLTVLISNTSIIVLVCVLWYVIGFFLTLITIYVTEYQISVLALLLSLIMGVLGLLTIVLFLLVKYELFDNIVIYKNK